ncbi:Ig heavy chain V region PJ14, partial [Varanus komodoensis]
MSWVRQPPGKGLEWAGVVWSNGALNYNSALRNRLTISRDTSKGQVFLQVRDLKPEDSGLYYCARGTVTLTESEGGVKGPEETLQLTCAMSGVSLSCYAMSWVRQASEKWAASIGYDGAFFYNTGLRNRLTNSRDTSKSHVFLYVRNLKPEDCT